MPLIPTHLYDGHYPRLLGRSGGQTLIGGTLTGNTLTLKGSALDDGDVLINPDGGNVTFNTYGLLSHEDNGVLIQNNDTTAGLHDIWTLEGYWLSSSSRRVALSFDNAGQLKTTENSLRFVCNSSQVASIQTTGVEVGVTSYFLFSEDGNPSGTPDTGIARDSAGNVRITSGTSGNGGLLCDYLTVLSTDGSDQVGIYHTNTEWFIGSTDGDGTITTFEGTNTDFTLNITGNGTGKGTLNNTGGRIAAITTKIADYTILTSDYTVLLDATSNTVTATLPASPIEGQIFRIKCIDSTYTCTVARNGKTIDGDADDFVLIEDEVIEIQADSSGNWWII